MVTSPELPRSKKRQDHYSAEPETGYDDDDSYSREMFDLQHPMEGVEPQSSPTARRLREDQEARHHDRTRAVSPDLGGSSAKLLTRPASKGEPMPQSSYLKAGRLAQPHIVPDPPKPVSIFPIAPLAYLAPTDRSSKPVEDSKKAEDTEDEPAPSRHSSKNSAPALQDPECCEESITEQVEQARQNDASHESESSSPATEPVKHVVQPIVIKSDEEEMHDTVETDASGNVATDELEGSCDRSVEPHIASKVQAGSEDQEAAEEHPIPGPSQNGTKVVASNKHTGSQLRSSSVSRPASRSASETLSQSRRSQSTSPILSQPGNPGKVVKKRQQARQYTKLVPPPSRVDVPDNIGHGELAWLWQRRCEQAQELTRQAEDATRVARATFQNSAHRIDELEKSNTNLQKAIEKMEQKQTESEDCNNNLLNEVTTIREKYYKLKDFAKQFNRDLHTLRGVAKTNKTLAKETLAAGQSWKNDIVSAQKTITETLEGVERQRTNIARTRSDLQHHVNNFNNLEQLAQEKGNQLHQERIRNRELQNYILDRDAVHAASESETQTNIRTIVTWMTRVSNSIGRLDTTVSNSNVTQSVEECLQIVKALRGTDVATRQHILGVIAYIGSMQRDLVKRGLSLDQSFQDLASQKNADKTAVHDLQTHITEVTNMVRELKPQLTETGNLQVEREKARGELAVQKALLEQSQERVAATDKKLEEALGTKQKTAAEKDREWQIRYNSAQSNLGEAITELEIAQKKTKELEQELQAKQSELEERQTLQKQSEEAASKRHSETSNSYEQKLKGLQEISQKTIDDLKASASQIDERLKASKEEVKCQRELVSQHESHISKLEAAATQLRRDKEQSAAQLLEAQSEIGGLRQKAAELITTTSTLNTARKEVERLIPFETQTRNLSNDVHGLKERLATAIENIGTLRGEVETITKRAELVPGLEQNIEEYKKSEQSLQVKLSHAQAEAKHVPGLRKKVEADEIKKSDLLEEVNKLRPLVAQLDTSREKSDRIDQELTQVKKNLAAAQQQIKLHADLAGQLRSRDEQVANLQEQLKNTNEAQANLEIVIQESQQKDSQISQLQKEVNKLKLESQALENINRPVNDELGPPLPQRLGSQRLRLKMPREDSQAMVEQEAVVPESQHAHVIVSSTDQRPRRKTADRSAPPRLRHPSVPERDVEIANSQNLSQQTDVIPESQPVQTPKKRPEEPLNFDSPLTEISDGLNGEGIDQARPQKTGEARQHSASSRPAVNPFGRPELAMNPGRPSSSSSNMDLFYRHEYDLGTQRADVNVRLRADDAEITRTVSMRDLELHRAESLQASQQYLSPMRLRNSTFHGAHSQESDGSPGQRDTSDINQRPLPNSALKRAVDKESQSSGPENPSKRPRRDIEAMKVRESTPVDVAGTRVKPSTPRQKIGGTIKGTNAPAPGYTTQSRRPKGAKGGSLNSAYASAFGGGTQVRSG